MPLCRFLTSSLTPQQSNDASTLEKSIKKCDQKRSQGKIVDFLNKQAQQPASDTTSGLRPRDVHALSSGTKKRENYPRRPDLIDSASVVSASGHRPINPGACQKWSSGPISPAVFLVSFVFCLLASSTTSRQPLPMSQLTQTALKSHKTRYLSVSCSVPVRTVIADPGLYR
ncbi:hypothetical protein BGW80DRAFT_154483 [Lactifluus volemus]|nr:hypothetical protein BGW80DRAFT_154483 [Lactifluus volemus]